MIVHVKLVRHVVQVFELDAEVPDTAPDHEVVCALRDMVLYRGEPWDTDDTSIYYPPGESMVAAPVAGAVPTVEVVDAAPHYFARMR